MRTTITLLDDEPNRLIEILAVAETAIRTDMLRTMPSEERAGLELLYGHLDYIRGRVVAATEQRGA